MIFKLFTLIRFLLIIIYLEKWKTFNPSESRKKKINKFIRFVEQQTAQGEWEEEEKNSII